MIKVSVIIPAYNIEKYIQKCLNSIINQTFKGIEIIVINDNSCDKTLQKINEIKKTYEDIIVINNNRNKGVSNSRKLGLDKAKGKYVIFVDGDDWLEIETIEKLYNIAEVKRSDIVLYNAYLTWDNEKKKLNCCRFDENKDKDYLKLILLDKIQAGVCFKFIRKEYFYENYIEFPENIAFGEDLALSTLLFMFNPKISVINNNLYNYYQRYGSATKSEDNRILDIYQAMQFIKNWLINLNLYEKYKQEFEYLAYKHMYYYRILGVNTFKSFHKQSYIFWKKMNINIMNNKYFCKEYNNMTIGLKTKINIFNHSYTMGRIYTNILKNRS